jgi:hypothetical protein
MHWLLNPDAELELARPVAYSPKRHVIQAMRAHAEKFSWLTGSDPSSFLDELPVGNGARALLWCATPRGLASAERAGFKVPPAPSLSALTAANLKGNVEALGLPRPKVRAFVRNQAELDAVFACLRDTELLRIKRALSFAGRAQRRLSRELSPQDRRYLSEAFNMGGVLVESEQRVEREWSIHGVVWGGPLKFGGESRFDVVLGDACAVVADEHGSVTSIQADVPGPAALRDAATRAARGLYELGYFGPFGLDFLEGDHGLVASDLNARFTLGWSIGMGKARDDALRRMFRAD